MKSVMPRSKRKCALRPLACMISCQIALLIGLTSPAVARKFFDPAFLEIENPALRGADLTIFDEGSGQAPGIYRVDLYLNGEMVETRDMDFQLQKSTEDKPELQPCLSRDLLASLGVRVDAFPVIKASETCVDLSQAIPQAYWSFHFSQQRLDISIPQIALDQKARDYVSPDKWDAGIPVLLANYNFSGASNWARKGDSEDSDAYYLNLRSGANLGAWRLRNYSTWSRNTQGETSWNSINTWLQRDIVTLKSQLTLGDSTTPSDVFDSVPFRGGQLASDDEMLPDSMKGYSPVVRGIAKSNAQVTIRQNGYVIYQSYVPPGAFEITDLYPTSGSGDLNVNIKEADGSEQNLTVPFASVPVLQREGRFKYSVTSGQYRSWNHDVNKTPFSQATGIYGLPWGATLYGGVQAASKYQSVSLGWGQNLGRIGALSADVTQAWTRPQYEEKESGQSWRIRYGKNFVDTGTSFSVANYRYSTKGYYSLEEALETYTDSWTTSMSNQVHKKNRGELTLSQSLWRNAGALSLSLISENYWNDNQRNFSSSLGYNNSWEGISYGLNYTYSKNGYDSNGDRTSATDHVVSFNISIPLGNFLPNSYATYNMTSSQQGATSNNVGLNGTALENDNLSYSISQGYTSQGQGANGYASADYRGGLGEVNVGYGYDRNMQRLNYGIQGGVLLHENGLTLSQPLGETVALVKAPGAKGVRVLNQTGVDTDGRGYAVVPYLSSYRRNLIALDTTTLGEDLDLTLNSQTVIPRRGAVVRAEYKTNIGMRVLLTLIKKDGQPVPFGTTVTDPAHPDNSAGFVGDEGQVYMTGLAESGRLLATWGKQASQQCEMSYSLAGMKNTSGVRTLSGQCL